VAINLSGGKQLVETLFWRVLIDLKTKRGWMKDCYTSLIAVLRVYWWPQDGDIARDD